MRRAENRDSTVRAFFLTAGVETSFLPHQHEGSNIYVGGLFSSTDYSPAFTTRKPESDTRLLQ